jgi:Nif-specific regulatory protein
MIELEVLEGESRGQSYNIEDPIITIGRHAENRIVLPDYHISGEHAQIFWEDNQYILRDLRSTSGSILVRNKQSLPLDGAERWEIPLKVGDQLRLGAPFSPVVLHVRAIDSVEVDLPRATVMAARTLEQIDSLRTSADSDRDLAAILYRLVQTIGRGGLELNQVLTSVSDAVFDLLDRASNVSIYLRDPVSLRFRMAYSRSREGSVDTTGGSRSLIEMVLKKKAAILVADAPEEMAQSASILSASIRSIMAVPMWNGNQIAGVIQCDNRTRRGMFQEHDLEHLTLLSYQSILAIENARMYQQLEEKKERAQSENNYFRQRTPVRCFSDIIGSSLAMKRIFDQLEKVIDTRVAISVRGETGTGKELIASAIHYQSRRRDKMFVAQNCAALPETLLESELFGHTKGAFTGAERDKKGLFEIADGGTLFLDEIADMPLSLQVKLLRVLQEGEIRPLGSTVVKFVDVRIISASHKNLEEEVAAVLPPACVPDPVASPSRTQGGHPPARGALRSEVCMWHAQECDHGSSDAPRDAGGALEGQRPRAGERGAATGDPGRRRWRDPAGRSASPTEAGVFGGGREGRARPGFPQGDDGGGRAADPPSCAGRMRPEQDPRRRPSGDHP